MGDEYLSTGFTDVDGARDIDAYSRCLSFLDALPYYRNYKRRTYELLDLKPGVRVLDAGCGLGDDVFRMAEMVRPGGCAVGLDSSESLLGRAREDERASRLPVEFHPGDLKALPFPDRSFSRCRIDRVLQHVPDPGRAVRELARVLEPDGLLLAYDNDWGTFSVTSRDRKTTRALETAWCDSFTNGWIGRQLRQHFIEAGLADVMLYPGTSVISDFEAADRMYNLRETARRAVSSGLVSRTDASRWIGELMERTAEGTFAAALTAYTVIGRKPA